MTDTEGWAKCSFNDVEVLSQMDTRTEVDSISFRQRFSRNLEMQLGGQRWDFRIDFVTALMKDTVPEGYTHHRLFCSFLAFVFGFRSVIEIH